METASIFPPSQSRFAGSRMRSFDNAYSISRERTLQRGRQEIENIVSVLQISGGGGTVGEALRFYEIAVDRNFTKGRRTSQVAAACLYIHCRDKKKPYLLIDFSVHLMISVYVLGAVFLQLCETLRLADHPIVQGIVDPSLFIHRFVDSLVCQGSKKDVVRTALQIVASMKRDWIQTGRKPSGLCGAAIYISALSHGLNCTKSDVVTVVRVCEATLTKRLIEFENTESGGLTIEEFERRACEFNEESVQSQLPRPGQVLCKHKDEGVPHFAHGLCKKCFEEFNEISGGLEGGAEPPAFQRAERERMKRAKEQEKMRGSTVEEMESGVSKFVSDSTRYESLGSCEHENTGDQAVDISAWNEPEELTDHDPESLSDIDDVEVNGYLHNEEEKRLKTIIWEEMNKEYLEEQAAKEAAEEYRKAHLGNLSEANPIKKKRKQRPAGEEKKTPADSALKATKQMLESKTFSSRVNYEALESLYTMDGEKEKKIESKFETGNANGETDAFSEYADISDVDDGNETGNFEDGGYEQVSYVPEYDHFGEEDGSYGYDLDFVEV
ncbi:transcription factor IIIB 60 kDa subunit isoform X2 [Asparagus officinalis]|uniref:transcription factor IIIB 60 kDa subunit isoform X2 n=1 Tax=Asparagus officinalis TaxID=4686 RepID=UPI00098E471A|nr:transcription factor IIIB 60 kDa subunit isoform X2 [Asparagus officinalis]